jgi:hypothetical protein
MQQAKRNEADKPDLTILFGCDIIRSYDEAGFQVDVCGIRLDFCVRAIFVSKGCFEPCFQNQYNVFQRKETRQ